VKSSKAQIQAKFHKIPVMRFEDQKLTSFSGLLVFQLLFNRLNFKHRLKQCFAHLKVTPIFGRHLVVLLLIIHLLIGYRRLREVDYYRDDPIVTRLMGLRKLPDVSTISRALAQMDTQGVENVRRLSRGLVIEALQRENLPRLTKEPPSVSTKSRKAPAVTIHCFAQWRKPGNFLTSTTDRVMSMIPTAPRISCWIAFRMPERR